MMISTSLFGTCYCGFFVCVVTIKDDCNEVKPELHGYEVIPYYAILIQK